MFLRYVNAYEKRKNRDMAYRIYISDSMHWINDMIANRFGGTSHTMRYYDLMSPQKEETRTGDEIINSMKEKLRKIGGA